MITPIFWIVPAASILALVFAWFFFKQMMKESEGTELMAKIAVILCNVIKCAWVVIMMEMVEDFMSHFNKKEIVPYGGIVLMLTAGLFDVAFSFVTLPVTYVLLYLVYGLIFRITHESVSKTFLCVVLIYIL